MNYYLIFMQYQQIPMSQGDVNRQLKFYEKVAGAGLEKNFEYIRQCDFNTEPIRNIGNLSEQPMGNQEKNKCLRLLIDGGQTLKNYLDNKADFLKPSSCNKIFLQICKAVGFLHSKQIVHGCINVENIWINTISEQCKLFNFENAIDLQDKDNEIHLDDEFGCHQIRRMDYNGLQKLKLQDIYYTVQIYNSMMGKFGDTVQGLIWMIENRIQNDNREVALGEERHSNEEERINTAKRLLLKNNISKIQLVLELFLKNHTLFNSLQCQRLHSIVMHSYRDIIRVLKNVQVQNGYYYGKKLRIFQKQILRIQKEIGQSQKSCLQFMMCVPNKQRDTQFQQKLRDKNLMQLLILIKKEFINFVKKIIKFQKVSLKVWVVLKIILEFETLFDISGEADSAVLNQMFEIKKYYASQYYAEWVTKDSYQDITDICKQIKDRYEWVLGLSE